MSRSFMNILTAKAMVSLGAMTFTDGVYRQADGGEVVIDDWIPPGSAYDETTPEGIMATRRHVERARLQALQDEYARLTELDLSA